MTRPEFSGIRSLTFSAWIRKNLPDSKTGFTATNQDWVFYNYRTKRLMLCEEKTHMGSIAKWFKLLITRVIDPALKLFCPTVGVDYRGYHLIQFENTCPTDGRIFVDGKEVSEEYLAIFLSMITNKI